MKKIGFMGAYDKANFMIYTAKVLRLLDYKVLVVDASSVQKIKYIIPAINPTKSYITSFEDIDFAVGFEEWTEVERYLGIRYDSNEAEVTKANTDIYDYVLNQNNGKSFYEYYLCIL